MSSYARLFRRLDLLPPSHQDIVLVIGNFDGVHRGHQHLLTTAHDIATSIHGAVAVLTFEPHPRIVFRPDDAPFRLTPARQKFRLLADYGVSQIIAQPFNLSFANLSARLFLGLVFTPSRRIRHVVVGDDFCFGHQRQGNIAMLRDYGHQHGFAVTSLQAIGDDLPYSSSRIRQFLRDGDIQAAETILGRPWQIEGQVQTGQQLARQWGFPTANISINDYLCPALGVYAVSVDIGQYAPRRFNGVANLGRRPTVNGSDLRFEVHLFDCDENLYGRHLRVDLQHFLRPEQKFDNLDALRKQITLDAVAAKQWLSFPPHQRL
jgi:riboflavin kinase/FMN adenylyltransferase